MSSYEKSPSCGSRFSQISHVFRDVFVCRLVRYMCVCVCVCVCVSFSLLMRAVAVVSLRIAETEQLYQA